jgi:hypothetical protein
MAELLVSIIAVDSLALLIVRWKMLELWIRYTLN